MKLLKSLSSIFGLLVVGVSLALTAILILNRQYVIDQFVVWQYEPSADMVSFADKSGMSDTGKFYFYASQPSLQNAAVFNEKCGSTEKSTAILGCYNGQNIYIYNVTDTKLDGIRETTAAHEMLHAAYVRMSDADKQKVDALLEAEYVKLKDNKKFAERMAFYARTEPGERNNELHSLIATEVADVNPELEVYYKQYFTDRGKVVKLYTKYASVFAALQTEADKISAQLTKLGDKIETATTSYNTDTAKFNSDVAIFKQDIESGKFKTQSELNASRNALLVRADDLDARRNAINSDADTYNSLRAQLQEIASQSEALNRSIDSSLSPAPGL